MTSLLENLKCHREKAKDNVSPSWGDADTLSAQVPIFGDELTPENWPTAVWLLLVARVLAVTVLNGLLIDKELESAESHPLLVQLADFEARLNATIDHHRKIHSGVELIGEAMIHIFHHEKGVEDPEKLLSEISDFVKMLQQKKSQAASDKADQPPIRAVQREPHTLQEYRDLFRLIPLPAVAETFESDETFARYRVAGPNPMVIRCVTKTELIVRIGDSITDQKFNEILKTNGDSVERAGDEGRLCVVDYYELSSTVPVVVAGSSFIPDPIAVFAEPLTGTDHIMPVAIQLGQDQKNSEIVMADTTDTYRWQMAKTTVQAADMIHHEIVSHLAHTHLVMEAFSVATQRHLKDEHPLSRLLRPHFEGTHLINYGAASTLISTDGAIDGSFANNYAPRLRSFQELATRTRLGFDFKGQIPDNDLASRGVNKLKVFPYRDDILDVWRAIQHWAEDYVELYYKEDKDVQKDVQLAAWSQDLLAHAKLANFEAPKTKQHLSETLSMIMFVASAQHAAVNFPQSQDMTFSPAMAGAVWGNIPPPDEQATEQDWLRMLPSMAAAEEQVNIAHLLGSVYYRRLGEYHSNKFPYCGTLEKKVEPALTSFRQELKAIETVIERRNNRRGSFAYRYLLPSEIPASVNI